MSGIKINKINNFNFTRIFNIQIPLLFVSSIENLNSIFGEQQLDNIITTLLLLDSYKGKKKKLELFKKNNITKCIQWCEINNIPYNKKISNKNEVNNLTETIDNNNNSEITIESFFK